MATKTFTDGSILKASDLNTYCANPLYTVIGSGSFSAASTFDVTGFTNTYDDFVLTVRTTHSASGAFLQSTFLSGATNYTTAYYSAGFRTIYTGTTAVHGTVSNGSAMSVGFVTQNGTTLTIGINGMNSTSRYPNFATQVYYDAIGEYTAFHGGSRDVNGISYDGMRFTHASGTGTGYWTLNAVRKP